MFDEWRRRRQLSKRIEELEVKRRRLEKESEKIRADYLDAERRHDVDEIDVNDHLYQEKFREMSWIETEQLKAEARKYDIVFSRNNTGWWWSDPDFEGSPADAYDMLTDEGKAGAIKQIKDESRAELDATVKMWTLIITLVIGLLGAASGFLSVYYSATAKSPVDASKEYVNTVGQ